MAEEHGVQELTRTRRLEVVDAQGRPQLLLGDLSGTNDPEGRHGIAVLGRDGTHRAWLTVDREGVMLGFDRNGSAVLEIAVEDGTGDSTITGIVVQISDARGRPIAGVHVDDDGAITLRKAAA